MAVFASPCVGSIGETKSLKAFKLGGHGFKSYYKKL